MNISRDHFNKIVGSTFAELQRLSAGKGAEYAGAEVNQNEHANFDRLAAKLQIIPEKVLWVYLTKHLDSIETYVNGLASPTQRVLSESIEGRIDDAILYLLLAKAMVIRRQLRGDKISESKSLGEMKPGSVTHYEGDEMGAALGQSVFLDHSVRAAVVRYEHR
jgi:hypothetical protein